MYLQAPELLSGRFRARKSMHKYNHHFPDDATPDSLTSDRAEILKEIFGAVGKEAFIGPLVNIDYGCKVILVKLSSGDEF